MENKTPDELDEIIDEIGLDSQTGTQAASQAERRPLVISPQQVAIEQAQQQSNIPPPAPQDDILPSTPEQLQQYNLPYQAGYDSNSVQVKPREHEQIPKRKGSRFSSWLPHVKEGLTSTKTSSNNKLTNNDKNIHLKDL